MAQSLVSLGNLFSEIADGKAAEGPAAEGPAAEGRATPTAATAGRSNLERRPSGAAVQSRRPGDLICTCLSKDELYRRALEVLLLTTSVWLLLDMLAEARAAGVGARGAALYVRVPPYCLLHACSLTHLRTTA